MEDSSRQIDRSNRNHAHQILVWRGQDVKRLGDFMTKKDFLSLPKDPYRYYRQEKDYKTVSVLL